MLKKIARVLAPGIYSKLSLIKNKQLLKKFKKDYPSTKIFESTEIDQEGFYSQGNQDYIVYKNFFMNKRDGVYCDIGGNHPSKFNNTKFFEDIGWTGYVFEPLPSMRELWNEERNAKLFPFALSDKEGEVKFTIVQNEFKSEDMFSFINETGSLDRSYQTKEINVKTKKLKNILSKEKIKNIDYMSIDVEGHELNILKGMDFSKVNINVLTIENNKFNYYTYGDEKIRDILFQNGYILWGRIIGLDDIYVKKTFLNQ
jgi:FkbM family methyltransferase